MGTRKLPAMCAAMGVHANHNIDLPERKKQQLLDVQSEHLPRWVRRYGHRGQGSVGKLNSSQARGSERDNFALASPCLTNQ